MRKKHAVRRFYIERRILRAAVSLHYWFMQPTDRDARNGPFYNKAFAALLVACDEYRKELGKVAPSKRTGLTDLRS